ncbi:MAG: hypothetical protein ACR2NS_13440, partial [Gemmatimonadaceae bacterium]
LAPLPSKGVVLMQVKLGSDDSDRSDGTNDGRGNCVAGDWHQERKVRPDEADQADWTDRSSWCESTCWAVVFC